MDFTPSSMERFFPEFGHFTSTNIGGWQSHVAIPSGLARMYGVHVGQLIQCENFYVPELLSCIVHSVLELLTCTQSPTLEIPWVAV